MDSEKSLLRNDLENQKTPEETKKSVEDAEILGYEDIAEFRKKKLGEIEFMADEISKTSESKISQVNELGGSSEELEHRTSEVDEKIEEVTENAQNEVGEVEKPSENIQQNEVVKVEEAIEGEQNLDTSGNQKESNLEKRGIKDGVDFVFEQNPELKKIGTKEQYSEYLDNIFPESKMRDIVYHGSGNKFDAFDKNKQETPGFYFTPDCNSAYFSKNDNIYSVILNTKNPISNFNEIYKIAEKGDINEFIKLGYDSIIELIEKREIIVFEPEQTYILGTTHDLESFKKFVENNQDSQG